MTASMPAPFCCQLSRSCSCSSFFGFRCFSPRTEVLVEHERCLAGGLGLLLLWGDRSAQSREGVAWLGPIAFALLLGWVAVGCGLDRL